MVRDKVSDILKPNGFTTDITGYDIVIVDLNYKSTILYCILSSHCACPNIATRENGIFIVFR